MMLSRCLFLSALLLFILILKGEVRCEERQRRDVRVVNSLSEMVRSGTEAGGYLLGDFLAFPGFLVSKLGGLFGFNSIGFNSTSQTPPPAMIDPRK